MRILMTPFEDSQTHSESLNIIADGLFILKTNTILTTNLKVGLYALENNQRSANSQLSSNHHTNHTL